MKVHDLKVWPAAYRAVADGYKNFELRKNDRYFQIGDWLNLKEWDPVVEEYSGYETQRMVRYIFDPSEWPFFGLAKGYVILGF